jgi:hypothetical protein
VTEGRHIGEDAAGVAALAHNDPARLAAMAHARACLTCARSLQQADRMLALLDGLPAAAEPPAASLRAASRLVLGRLATRVVPSHLLVVLLPSLCVILVAMAKHRAPGVGPWVQSGLLVAASLISLALLRVLGAGAAGFALGASVLATVPGWGPGSLEVRHGVACVLTELGVATAAAALTAWVVVRHRSRYPAPALVGTAVAGALTGQAALHLSCPSGSAGLHLLAFHVGGVVLAALMARLVAQVMAREPIPRVSTHWRR